jgi:predicted nucleotidyltransferase
VLKPSLTLHPDTCFVLYRKAVIATMVGQVVMMKNIQMPKEELRAFCHRHHVRKLSVFGSVLRDDFMADSDIDILVEFKPGHTVGFRIIDMEDELSVWFGEHKVDIGVHPKMRQ